ncbi:aromatic ring-hydroxylating dioxygenase subunit alpha [Ramlibacter sp. AW1]|uniref:Aromatic ring-hydroxylating dioxygenase subunit alpha n=1 Tax=Ramlibacter aurantiacus TaxID=2801330 RepID=A0A936ZQC4_9BURK|nr:aromatic ring-hydroxylating dioxygenase subunit alpha [Ramlibacter aurantiacus]MBL0421630.1 aromatic ring-hydroxylating dioxygenase subunit alpha [Ramlibacter aurantiacus]
MHEFIRNAWYPLAWNRDVDRSLVSRRVIGEDLVVYRTSDGQVAALRDVCPHRLLPLSKGRLRDDDAIECGYHGVTFDSRGACVRVPLQEKPPAAMRVRAYPTHQSMGMWWVWMGEPEKADTSKVFSLPQYSAAGWSYVEGDSLHMKANYLNLADNLCDPTHVAFVHLTTLSNVQSGDIPVHFDSKGSEVVTWRWVMDSPLIPIFQGLKAFDGNVDRWHFYHYLAPCVAYIDFGSALTGTGAPDGNRGDCIQMFACHFITPVDHDTCVQHWLCIKNIPADAGQDRKLIEGLRMAFNEDKRILEAIQENEAKLPDVKPVKIALDASNTRMRRIVDQMLAAEAAEAAVAVPAAATPAATAVAA